LDKVGRPVEKIAAEAALLVGPAFVRQISKLLAGALGVRHVLIGRIDPANSARVESISFWAGDQFMDDYSYNLADTPCENVFGKKACCHPEHVQTLFPKDMDLQTFNIQGYAGVPLFMKSGEPLGMIVALHDAPIKNQDEILETFEAFAPRIQLEIENLQSHMLFDASEKRLNSLLQSASAGIAVTDSDCQFIRCNEAFEKMLGYQPGSLLGTKIADNTHPDDMDTESHLIEKLVAGEFDHYRLEKRFIKRDGSQGWADLSVSALRDQNGKLVNLVGVILDMTERKKAESAVEEERERVQDILEGTNAGHWDWQVQTGELVINERWAEIMGYTMAELEPIDINTWSDNVHPDDLTVAEDKLEKHFAGKLDYYDVMFRQPHKSGEWVWVNARGRVSEWGEDGQPLRMSGIHLDVTDLKVMEEDLRVALVSAEQANQAKSEFLASMSHELRTPLNAVLGFAQMMLYDPQSVLTPRQSESIDHIMEGGQHLLSLINEVLDLSRIEADKIILSLDEVDAASLIADCVALVTPLGSERRVTLSQAAFDDSLILRTDRVRLKQVLLNLLSNAVNYNVDGGKVEVRAEDTGKGFIRISVKDTGVGIPENERSAVFNMFHRLDADPMVTRQGTGIGLTVSKLLIERMAGAIGFESQVGAGSTFWVEVPLATNLETLIWTDALLIDVEEIDQDHRKLASLVNQVGQLSLGDERLNRALEELVAYAGYHFVREEAIMKACDYEDIAQHSNKHDELRQQIDGFAEKWRESPSENLLSEVRKLLSNWLFNHIIRDDVSIAPFVRGREKEITAALDALNLRDPSSGS